MQMVFLDIAAAVRDSSIFVLISGHGGVLYGGLMQPGLWGRNYASDGL